MTVSTSIYRRQYATNGTTGPWSVPFYFLSNADLKVVYTTSAGIETVLTEGADYSVSGALNPAGGSVTTTTAYVAGGTITVLRDMEFLQETDYVDSDPFPAETHERALDRLTMLTQQVKEVTDRSIVYPVADEASGTLPIAASRANKLVSFNGSGALALVAPVDGSAASLALQLANDASTAEGAGQIGFLGTSTGAVGRTLSARLQDSLSVKDFGAVGDGVTDDTTALAAAFAVNRLIRVPAGTYLFTSTLSPTCAGIVGEGDAISVLKPSAAVTKAMSIANGGSYPRILADFKLDGVATTNATGLYLGDTASCAVMIYNVRIKDFGGGSGVGLRVSYVLKSSALGVTSEGCDTNLLIQQTAANSFPTTLHFDSCVFTDAGTYTAHIKDCNGIHFTNCDFESSANEGVYAETTAGRDIIELSFTKCWFEDNNSIGGSSSYHVRAVSNTGARVVRLGMRDCIFAVGNASRAQRMVKLDGQDHRGYWLSNMRPSADPGAESITIVNGAYGAIDTLTGYYGYATNVNVDATSYDFGPHARNKLILYNAAAPTIASATTIAPTKSVTFVSGSTTIETITPPGGMSLGGQVILIPTGAWATNTAGNIALASTGVVNKALIMTYDGVANKWYPSY